MLGDTLGLETVAEGIEQEDQVSALLALGCVAGQGFLFAPSTTLEALAISSFAVRRAQLWEGHAPDDPLTATGRHRLLPVSRPRSAA